MEREKDGEKVSFRGVVEWKWAGVQLKLRSTNSSPFQLCQPKGFQRIKVLKNQKEEKKN